MVWYEFVEINEGRYWMGGGGGGYFRMDGWMDGVWLMIIIEAECDRSIWSGDWLMRWRWWWWWCRKHALCVYVSVKRGIIVRARTYFIYLLAIHGWMDGVGLQSINLSMWALRLKNHCHYYAGWMDGWWVTYYTGWFQHKAHESRAPFTTYSKDI